MMASWYQLEVLICGYSLSLIVSGKVVFVWQVGLHVEDMRGRNGRVELDVVAFAVPQVARAAAQQVVDHKGVGGAQAKVRERQVNEPALRPARVEVDDDQHDVTVV